MEPALALVSGPITGECGVVSTNHSSPGHVGEEAAVRVVLTERLAVPGLGHLASSRVSVTCHVSRVRCQVSGVTCAHLRDVHELVLRPALAPCPVPEVVLAGQMDLAVITRV